MTQTPANQTSDSLTFNIITGCGKIIYFFHDSRNALIAFHYILWAIPVCVHLTFFATRLRTNVQLDCCTHEYLR